MGKLVVGKNDLETLYPDIAREWDYEKNGDLTPGKVSASIFYSEALSHRIYAGCDAFLMPSLFEPCGLSQLISFRYGTIPIARCTGGLRDTITGYLGDKEHGNGFTFWGHKVDDFVEVTKKALELYQHHDEWNELRK